MKNSSLKIKENGFVNRTKEICDALFRSQDKEIEYHTLFKILHMEDTDLNATYNHTTPLIALCRAGHLNGVKLLLNRGVNIDKKDHFGQSAISWACDYGHRDIVKLLINSGAELSKEHQIAGNALFRTVSGYDAEITKLEEHKHNFTKGEYDTKLSIIKTNYGSILQALLGLDHPLYSPLGEKSIPLYMQENFDMLSAVHNDGFFAYDDTSNLSLT
ncbi:MAG: ankyrin repeat domain-containing protein [Rickettsiaceae bacterium]|nr:ankyrin repeat domain-containing protein [Rickettsiaceae bacterium]